MPMATPMPYSDPPIAFDREDHRAGALRRVRDGRWVAEYACLPGSLAPVQGSRQALAPLARLPLLLASIKYVPTNRVSSSSLHFHSCLLSLVVCLTLFTSFSSSPPTLSHHFPSVAVLGVGIQRQRRIVDATLIPPPRPVRRSFRHYPLQTFKPRDRPQLVDMSLNPNSGQDSYGLALPSRRAITVTRRSSIQSQEEDDSVSPLGAGAKRDSLEGTRRYVSASAQTSEGEMDGLVQQTHIRGCCSRCNLCTHT